MALIPHSLFPRSMFDTDNWWHPTQPNTLDVFDPFDELDHTIANNLQWLTKPDFMSPLPMLPAVPQKWRVTVDCAGYMPKSVKTEIVGHKLIVSGREEVKQEGEDFSIKEFKKTYDLPAHAQTDKLVSFMTSHGHLVIEMPLSETHLHPNDDLLPRITQNTTTGGQDVKLKFHVPENIHRDHVKVSIKDRDLIVKAEDKVVKPDGVSKFYFYKRTTLPENTDFEHLKCTYDNHKLSICAPLNLNWKPVKKVAIEPKKV